MSAAVIPNIDIKLANPSRQDFVRDWSIYEPFVVKACERSLRRLGPEAVKEGVSDGSMIPFVVWSETERSLLAVLIGEIATYPGDGVPVKVFSLVLCGGTELERWVHLVHSFADIAEHLGADQFEISGRMGWGRILGLKPLVATFVIDIQARKEARNGRTNE